MIMTYYEYSFSPGCSGVQMQWCTSSALRLQKLNRDGFKTTQTIWRENLQHKSLEHVRQWSEKTVIPCGSPFPINSVTHNQHCPHCGWTQIPKGTGLEGGLPYDFRGFLWEFVRTHSRENLCGRRSDIWSLFLLILQVLSVQVTVGDR